MLTIKEVKEEYNRISKLLKIEAVTTREYDYYCKEGYSMYLIKRDLGLTYKQMKTKIGAKQASTLNNGGKFLGEKIPCLRDGGQIIREDDCVPGCNDACEPCQFKDRGEIKASDDTLTIGEEATMRYTGAYRSSSAIAIEDGYIDNTEVISPVKAARSDKV